MKGKDSHHSSTDSESIKTQLSSPSDLDTGTSAAENTPEVNRLLRSSASSLSPDTREDKQAQESSKIRVRDLASLESLAAKRGRDGPDFVRIQPKRFCSPNRDLDESFSDLTCERDVPDDDPVPQDLSKSSRDSFSKNNFIFKVRSALTF